MPNIAIPATTINPSTSLAVTSFDFTIFSIIKSRASIPAYAMETLNLVTALHTQKVTAMPFPPLNFIKGENTCPRIGAIAAYMIDGPLINPNSTSITRGKYPFKKSKIIPIIPILIPAALQRLKAPGLPSPILRKSFFLEYPAKLKT